MSALSARARLWLPFLALAAATVGLLAAGAWLDTGPSWLWLVAALALVGCQALIWLLLDRGWVRPAAALAREIRLLLHANAERRVAAPPQHGLGELVPAVLTLAERWRGGRAEQDAALARAMAGAGEQQSRLEAVLRNLSDGLIACAADRRILLFNEAALQALERAPADLVLLDVMMPQLDGFEVCQRIRADPRWAAVKIIMLTAKGREVERDKGRALGADAYVTKPFSTRELVARVKKMLGAG
jgi:CheY-like chemotaxis protein